MKVTGTGLKYKWQVPPKGSTEWKNSGSTGNTTDTLSITLSSGWGGAQFRCVITDANCNSVTSDVVAFTVIDAQNDS